jgi:F-type H+-transporting ATPase subunit b
LEFSIWDFLATLLNFALLLFILYKLLWKKLINAMDSRKNQIDESLEKAELARKEVSETKTKISADIENARRQAREIVEQSQRAGEEAKNVILKQANEAADAALVRAQEEIEQQKISAISDIKSEVAQLVIMVTEKVLAENVSPEQHKALVDKYIKELEGLK